MTTPTLPFGLHFQEHPLQSNDVVEGEPFYDPTTGLSYILDESGERHPYILWAWATAGVTNTGTTTKMAGDEEDTDPPPRPARTQTVTEVRQEMTDSDY